MVSNDESDVLGPIATIEKALAERDSPYPEDPRDLSRADEEALFLEWLETRSETRETFADFLRRRLYPSETP